MTLIDQLQKAESDAVKMRAVLARFPDAELRLGGHYLAASVLEQADGIEWLAHVDAGAPCLYALVQITQATTLRVYSPSVVAEDFFAALDRAIKPEALTAVFRDALAIQQRKASAEVEQAQAVKVGG